MQRLAWTAAACLPGIVLLLVIVNGRVGVTYDSVYYLSAARILAESGRLETDLAPAPENQFAADGSVIARHPLVNWPPGYPVVVALVARTGVSIATAAVVVNVAALIVLVTSTVAIAARTLPLPAAAIAAATVGVLPAVQATFRMAWSEPLFTAMAAVVVASLVRMTVDPRSAGSGSFAAGLVAGLSTGVRYLGLSLIVTHALVAGWCLVRDRGASWRKLLPGLIAGPATAALVVMARARVLDCWPCDVRTVSFTNPLTVFGQGLEALMSLVPVVRAYPGPIDSLVSIAVLAVLGPIVCRRRIGVRLPSVAPAAAIALLAGTAYAALVIALKIVTYFDPIDGRLLSPAIVLISAGILLVFAEAIDQRRALVAIAAFGLYFAAVSFVDGHAPTMRWRSINDETLTGHPAIQAIVAASGERAVLSDDAATMSWHAGRPVLWLPRAEGSPVSPPHRLLLVTRTSAVESTNSCLTPLVDAGTRTQRYDAWTLRWIDDAPSSICR